MIQKQRFSINRPLFV